MPSKNGNRIFTNEEIQDLEDAIFFAIERIAWKQETGPSYYDQNDLNRMNRFVERLLKLKTRLAEPLVIGSDN